MMKSRSNWKLFENCYSTHVEPVYRYLYVRLGSKQEAEDVTSEVFLKALEHFDTYDTEKPFAPWIFTIARHELLHWIQKKKPTVSLDDIVEIKAPFDLVLEAQEKFDFEEVRKGLILLDEDKRTMVEMKYMMGYSYKEIGDMLGKEENAVKVATFRALAEIRKNLSYDSRG